MNQNRSRRIRSASAYAALTLATLAPAGAQLTSQLGILDLTANGGTNPATGAAWQEGDQYRFIFATSTGRDGTSADIADYNTFVQNAADASPLNIGATQGVTWTALASTETVAANVNTGTDTGSGVSIWLLDGTSLVADDYADFYATESHSNPINVSETGGTPFDGGDYTSVWTGSDGSGNIKTNAGGGVPGWLGTVSGVDNQDGNSHTGLWNFTSGAHWIDRFQVDNTDEKALYGMSVLLTLTAGESDPPTLTSFANDKGDGPIVETETVTYTVTFSEAMKASTVEVEDFENASLTEVTIDSVHTTPDAAVYEVEVTPVEQGTLQLQVRQDAVMTDLSSNALDTSSPITDTVIIDINADTTPPTVLSFANDVGGGPITEDAPVTYTVTFDKAMNEFSIEADDFENAGSPAAAINSVSTTGDPAVFEVSATPGGVGTLQLQIAAEAFLEDFVGNALDTTTAIADPTIISVTESTLSGLSGQLGILDLTANSGLNPATGNVWQAGDQYRFIFATSTGRDATSTDIADYNTFVQNAADASPLNIGAANGVTWTALASTETVAANVNTGTDTGPGVSIWLMDGITLVADDYADLYEFDSHSSVINVSETGGTPFDGGDYTSVWTGSNGLGGIKTNDELGAQDGTSLTGLWNFTSGRHWIERFSIDNTGVKALYGMSELLTVSGGGPAIQITSITPVGGGMWELTVVGDPSTGYEFWSSPVLDFDPGTLVENLTQGDPGDPGTIGGTNGNVLTTDSNGDGTVRMMLTGNPADFVRAQIPPPPPPLLSESFDDADALPADWSSNGPINGTNWEVGDPSTGYPSGPSTAKSGSNCAGTNVNTNGGEYTNSIDISLTSPTVTIPAGVDATLTFEQFADTDLTADLGSVRILDADNADAPIAGLEITGIEGDGSQPGADWTTASLNLPAGQVGGKNIKVEFQFVTNDAGVFGGFYIDDVEINVTAP